jgi:RluA family pseudouridine synthase
MTPTVQPEGFDILCERGPCLVVAKPGGVATQAPAQFDSLERRIRRFLQQRETSSGSVYLGVPHRLDRPVSGAIVFAKTIRGARRLSEQFAGRLVQKKYWALVEGAVAPHTGVWTDHLRKIPDRAQAEIVASGQHGARLAVLRYRTLAVTPVRSWLEIELETGRMHQIRVQAAARGHPILGDQLYGAASPFGPPAVEDRQKWIALHAQSLAFRDPKTRKLVLASAPLPRPWIELGLENRDG